MPDPTYKTFLSPGSCQLEVTDLVASANDDKGVDLYGVAWEIEQVLIAGEGFAASPTDVWVNERGILNVGQSLFDKINRTAEDNDNIPGQCTVVVKATSLVDSSKVARLKVLVGYPSEGGGGGGGGGVDFGHLIYFSSLSTTPVVGEEIDDGPLAIASISVADSVICEPPDGGGGGIKIAAGCTVKTTPAFVTESPSAYVVEYDEDYIIKSAVEFSGTITVSGEAGAYEYTFVVPDAEAATEGDYVVLAIVASLA